MAASRVGPRSAATAARWILCLVASAIVGVQYVPRLRLLEVRGFNPDELEHLHFSWLVSKGLLPYRDYFEHHTPWLHYLMAPVVAAHDVETSVTEAVGTITLARELSWLFAGAILAVTALLGLRWRAPIVACAGAVFLADAAFFQDKSLEFRPDVAASALLVAAVLLMMAGLRSRAPGSPRTAWTFAGAGLCLGAAVMFTQKVLLAGPGFALTVLAYLARSDGARLRDRLRNVAIETACVLGPVLATLGYFTWKGAGGLFVALNLAVNTGWPAVGPSGFLRELVEEDPLLVLFVTIGFVLVAAGAVREPIARRADLLIVLCAASLALGLFVLPAVTRHYFLLPLPFFALLAAEGLHRVTSAGLRLVHRDSAVATHAAVALVLVLLSGYPVLRFARSFDRGNTGALEAIRYVLRNAAPWETVLDGFTGFAPFRRHGYYYPFLYEHTMAIQTPEQRRALVEGLRSGAIAPKLILRNHYLEEGVLPEAASFIASHYVPYGPAPIHVRLFDAGLGWWSDEGARPIGWAEPGSTRPHLYVGEGWKQPDTEDGRSVRHSRGRRAELVVPIRTVADYTMVVRAFARRATSPAALALAVGREPLGARCTVEGWADYSFQVPARLLTSGLNGVVLSYPAAGECGEPPSGENSELTVASLDLRRVAPAPEAHR
jgi:hypothetical protein